MIFIYIKNYVCGHIVESVELESLGSIKVIGNYRKISKDRIVNIDTGEIIDVKHAKTRADQMQVIRRSIRKLRMIINANFFGEDNELFITLTYAENMTDLKRLYKDFNKFVKRLKYRYKDYGFEYIAVPEPQLRGAWHLHLLLKAMNKGYLYISNDEIAELWSHGFTKTERLKGVDNIGAYVSSYLTNIYNEDTGTKAKGARLYLYPVGMNLYRCSRGIKRPEIVVGDIGLDNKYKVYEKQFEITRDDEVVNVVTIKQYNLKRVNN